MSKLIKAVKDEKKERFLKDNKEQFSPKIYKALKGRCFKVSKVH